MPRTSFTHTAPACLRSRGRSPVIVLPGYSGPQLFLDAGRETEQQIWAPQLGGKTLRSIADVLLTTLPKLLAGAGGNADAVVAKFGELAPILEKLTMNEDGSSKYNISPLPQHARDARWDVMLERGQERLNIAQRPTTNSMLEYIPADRIYIFGNDWRMGQVEGSNALHTFIQEVKEDSGSEKVSLLGVSYGGQLAAAYFTFYGGTDIDRAVLHAPAIRGSALTVDILEKPDFAFSPASLLDLAAISMQREFPFSQRLNKIKRMVVISDIAVRVIRAHLLPLLLKFGSFWDIVPPKDYERLKAQYLDPVKNAEIIRKSDIVHYEMMPNIGETLRSVQRNGVKIALIAGTGLSLASGNPIDSDVIIDVASTTGALSVPLNIKPPTDMSADLMCESGIHPHRSPDGRIDASCAYLPGHTWFFRGQYHGQAVWDRYARQLYNKWLFTDDIQDVWSDPAFPQFRDSCNPADGLEARFSESVCGYLTALDEALLLTNLSNYDISLLSVQAEGLGFEAPIVGRVVLRHDETVRLRFRADLPAHACYFDLTVDFMRKFPVPARERRTFSFTALPDHEEIPAWLRFPDSGPSAASPQQSITALPLSGEKRSGSHRRVFSNNSVLTQKKFRPAKQKAEEPTDIL